MDFMKALEISIKFQEAYEILKKAHGDNLSEKAKNYIRIIKCTQKREHCSCVEAVSIILKNWHHQSTIPLPLSGLTLWLLASVVIIEQEQQKP